MAAYTLSALDAALRLLLTPGLGHRYRAKLIRRFGSPHSALDASPREWSEGAEVPPHLHARALSPEVGAAVRDSQSRCARRGLQIIALGTDAYPQRLASIHDPPMVLFVRGELPPLDRLDHAVGIVGTRKPSSQALAFAYRLGYELTRAGAIVVSGLAMGIDAESHRGTIAANGTGIGVLAGGPDRIHPPGNEELGLQLLERGCLLSEQPPGTTLHKGLFVARNRVISGLARVLIVVEAGLESGALRTSEFALDQGRPVYAMPGRPGDPRIAGCLGLLKDGATPIVEPEDVLPELGLDHPVRRRGAPDELGAAGQLLRNGNVTFDALLEASGLSPPRLLALLGRLELTGKLGRAGDGSYYLRAG